MEDEYKGTKEGLEAFIKAEEGTDFTGVVRAVMSKQGKVLAQLAGLALGVTAIFYVAFFLVGYLPRFIGELTIDLLGLVSMVFCPASLAIVQPFAIYEFPHSIVGDPGTWVIIGLANSASYAAIGYLTIRLLSRAGAESLEEESGFPSSG